MPDTPSKPVVVQKTPRMLHIKLRLKMFQRPSSDNLINFLKEKHKTLIGLSIPVSFQFGLMNEGSRLPRLVNGKKANISSRINQCSSNLACCLFDH